MAEEKAQTVTLSVAKPDDGMNAFQFVSSMTASLAWPIAAVLIATIFQSQIKGLLYRIKELAWGDKKVSFADKLDKIEQVAEVIGEKAALSADLTEEPEVGVSSGQATSTEAPSLETSATNSENSTAAAEAAAVAAAAAAAAVANSENATALAAAADAAYKAAAAATAVMLPATQVAGHDDRFNRLVEISPNAALLESWGPVDRRLRDLATMLGMESAVKMTIPQILAGISNMDVLSHEDRRILMEMQKLRNRAAHNEQVTATDAYRFADLAKSISRTLDQRRLIEKLRGPRATRK